MARKKRKKEEEKEAEWWGKGKGLEEMAASRVWSTISDALQASFLGSTFTISLTLPTQVKRMSNGEWEGKRVALTNKTSDVFCLLI